MSREPAVTPAHDQRLTIHLVEQIPSHGPRGPAFDAAKRRMQALGLDKCAIEGCDTGAPIEYHHTIVEHAWQEGVDIDKLNRAFGLHLSDEEFAAWVQSPGSLEPLCAVHHRTQLGLQALPEPLWNALRVWRSDLAPQAVLAVNGRAGTAEFNGEYGHQRRSRHGLTPGDLPGPSLPGDVNRSPIDDRVQRPGDPLRVPFLCLGAGPLVLRADPQHGEVATTDRGAEGDHSDLST